MQTGGSQSQSAHLEALTEQGIGLPDPIAVLMEDHELQLQLCDVLEKIADNLPESIEPELGLVVARILRKGMPQHMRFEEDVLFPLLRKRAVWEDELEHVLRQLEEEHESDESYGFEIADELEALSECDHVSNPEMLGYMLRGFFDSQRRHIEWENTIVFPFARRVLTQDDLHALREQLLNHLSARQARQSLLMVQAVLAGNHQDVSSVASN